MLNTRLKHLLGKLKLMSKHPYFGYLVFGAILIVCQMLTLGGVISGSLMDSIISTLIYASAALGFALLLGYGGMASLGTAAFIGLGTYIIGFFSGKLELPFILTLLIAFGGAIILGAIVGFISLRIEGMYLAIITLGLSEIFIEIYKSFKGFTNGVDGLGFRNFQIFNIPMSDTAVQTMVIIAFVILMIVTINVINSPTGRAMLAMKDSTAAAQSMGISLLKYRLFAFVISTVFAVLAGILYMAEVKFSSPPTWGLTMSLSILAAVIVGGEQSIVGIILGTFIIFNLNTAVLSDIPFFSNNPDAQYILNGLLIIVIVMFYPGGLIRLIQSVRAWIKKKFNQLKHKWKVYRYGADE